MTESIFQTIDNLVNSPPDSVSDLRILASRTPMPKHLPREVLIRAADELESMQRWNVTLRAQVMEAAQREQALLERIKAHQTGQVVTEPLMVRMGAVPIGARFYQPV